MFKEFEMQRMLNHTGIVKTMYFLKRTKGAKGEEREIEFNILLEHMEGGNLQQYLNKQPETRMPNIYKAKVFTQRIVETVAYLHSMNIVHRDIKTDNILLSKELDDVKLCDFGVSGNVDDTRWTSDARGTIRYMAPELFDRKLTKKADIWAIGCIVLQFITGKRPYHGYPNEHAITRKLFLQKETPLDYAKKKMRHELLGYDKKGGRKIVTQTWYNSNKHL